MSTGTKIIQGALSKLGAHSIAMPANPESIENGRAALNGYISQLQDDNINFGAVTLDAVGSELSEPQGLTNAIEDNLAILLQPQHPGSQISAQLRINANTGYGYMVRKYQTICIPKRVVSKTMPLGAGNKGHGYDRVFFSGEADTSCASCDTEECCTNNNNIIDEAVIDCAVIG